MPDGMTIGPENMQDNPLIDGQDEFKFKTRDVKSVRMLRVLVALAVLYTIYFAQSLLVPLIFSALTALLLSPLVNKLQKIHFPRSISAILLLAMLVAPITFLGTQLVDPIERWMKLVPELTMHVTNQLDELSDSFESERQLALQKQKEQKKRGFFSWFKGEEEQPVVDEGEENVVEEQLKEGGAEVLVSVAAAAPLFLAQVFGSLILIVFLLSFGPSLFKVFVHDFPIVKNKHRANFLVKSIQNELSKYILTISIINCALGVATATALFSYGVEDAILWGAIVGLFNFVPYIGTLFSLVILGIVGVVQFGVNAGALIPAGIFFALTIIEAQIVTPAVLGRSMRVNPLIIIIWLMMTGWLWGIFGVLLAVPLLVCIKLALDQMKIFPHWLKLIEASDRDLDAPK